MAITRSYFENLTDEQKGKLLFSLIIKALERSDRNANDIQINFCLHKMPSNKATIKKYLAAYLKTTSGQLPTELQLKFKSIDELLTLFPANSQTTPSYAAGLLKRAESFHKAAALIAHHSTIDDSNKKIIIENLQGLFTKLQFANIKYKTDAEAQAYFNAFIEKIVDALKPLYQDIVFDSVDQSPSEQNKILADKIKADLINAELLASMAEPRKMQMTFTGDDARQIELQIDEPLTRFSDLTEEQQFEWMKILLPEEGGGDPTWFKVMPVWEQRYWINIITDIKSGRLLPDQVHIAPVVKKQFIPGLRNIILSSDFIFNCVGSEPKEIQSTAKTIRSSNLIAARKEKTEKLSQEELHLTKLNVNQVNHIYRRHRLYLNPVWKVPDDYQPITLYQTLLRPKGGGDDFVIQNKDMVISDINLSQGNFFVSNHCIGYGVNKKHGTALGIFFDMGHANTPDTKHLDIAIANFIDNIVLKQEGLAVDAIKAIREGASYARQGSLDPNYLAPFSIGKPKAEKLTKLLHAYNDYVKILKLSSSVAGKMESVAQNYQLHLAALEEIVYQESHNRIQSSCKSGKDREGILKCYRNALHHFYSKYKKFPPYEAGSKERQEFVNEFVKLFLSNHQQRLAALNSPGCEGLKALDNILPKDIYAAIEPKILKLNKLNSSLNELGEEKVDADKTAYQQAMALFNSSEMPTLWRSATPSSKSTPASILGSKQNN